MDSAQKKKKKQTNKEEKSEACDREVCKQLSLYSYLNHHITTKGIKSIPSNKNNLAIDLQIETHFQDNNIHLKEILQNAPLQCFFSSQASALSDECTGKVINEHVI